MIPWSSAQTDAECFLSIGQFGNYVLWPTNNICSLQLEISSVWIAVKQ